MNGLLSRTSIISLHLADTKSLDHAHAAASSNLCLDGLIIYNK